MLNIRHYVAVSLLICLIACVNNDCPFPEKHLANGQYHYEPQLPGHFGRVPENYLLIFECFPGFVMRGSSTIKCVNGKWTDEVPTCLNCPFPEKKIANGRYHYAPHAPVYSKIVPENYPLFFECFPGFIMRGSRAITCTGGKWTDEIPSCLNCPFPEKNLANGQYIYELPKHLNSTIAPENYRLRFQCSPGFTMRGSSVVTCIGGKWTDEVPSCLNCPFPKMNLENGQYIYESPHHANLKIAPEYYSLRFQCSPGSTIIGSNVITCIGGKWTHETPVCLTMNCRYPPNIANASYTLSSNLNVSHDIGTAATYTCDNGYELENYNDSVLTCSFNSEINQVLWEGVMPRCIEMKCRHPPSIPNASYKLQSAVNNPLTIGTTATYKCDRRYKLKISRNAVLTCTFYSNINEVKWTGVMPSCIKKKKKCKNPPSILNANYTLHSDTSNPLSIRTTATYECDPGYELKNSRNAVLTCTYDSDMNKVKWKGIKPRCIGMECENPPSIPNASYKLHSRAINPNVIGATANYTCDPGYQLKNSSESVLTCTFISGINETEWKGVMPRCLESCPNPGVSRDGIRKGNCCFIGDDLEFKCKDGFELVGSKKIECLPSGNWSALRPLCKPDDYYCEIPPTIPHGVAIGDKFGDYYSLYDEVEVLCQPGFGYSGSTEFIMCGETGWEEEFGECEEFFCEPPEPLEHGTIPEIKWSNITIYPFQFELTYICDEGFRLIGNSWRYCGSSGWSGEAPTCEEISCPDPGIPEHGERTGNSFEIDDKVAFKCFTGYKLIGSSERYCMPNGEWSNELARCDHPSNYCPDPGNPIRGKKNGTSYDMGARVSFSCHKGYALIGSEVRECLPSKEWSGEETKCLGPYYFDNSAKVRDILIEAVAEKEAEQKQALEKFHKGLLDAWRNGTEIGPSPGVLDIDYPKRLIFYFAFDVSQSVGESNFRKSIEFAKGVVRKIGISDYGARVGALTFSSKVKIGFLPVAYETTDDVLDALDRLNFTGGGTDANSAFGLIRNELIPLTQKLFSEKGMKSIIFILTHGKGNLGSIEEAELLKQSGVEIYWIAVANSVLRDSLYKAASDPKEKHVFILQNYAKLSDLVKEITKEAIVNGGWSEWSKWDSCSAGCGEGTTNRYRSCNNPIPTNGGKSCGGSSEETKICFSNEECPEIKCEDPPTIPKASYELHSGASDLFTIGTTSTYTCDPGYELENSTEFVLTCTVDLVTNVTHWKGAMQTCTVFKCGLRPGKKIGSGKIVGGRIVRDPWPWMAVLYIVKFGVFPEYRCGGSIIHEIFILTAAHCLYSNNHTKVDESEVLVKVGLTDVRNKSFLQHSEVEKIIIHPNYRSGPLFDYDIALLKLKTPIRFNSVVRPICLPPLELPDDTTFYKPREYLVAIGWGLSRVVRIMEQPHFQPLHRLKEIILPIQSPETCRKKEGYLLLLPKNVFSDRMFCAGDGRGGNDTCPGDSGGPAMQSQLDEGGRIYWTQVGIVSWGIGCGLANTYGYYTHVQKLVDWVTNNTLVKN